MFVKIPIFDYILVDEYGNIKNGKTGNILKPYSDKQGYQYVKVCINGSCKHISLHRAVAMAFCSGYFVGAVVDHIDGNKKNNYYKNLRWCTQKENLEFGYKRRNDDSVRNCCACKLYYNGELVANFRSICEAARYASKNFGVSHSMLCKHGETDCVKIRKCND